MNIRRRVATAVLLTAVAFAAIMGGLLLATRAADTNPTTSTATNSLMMGNETSVQPFSGFGGMGVGRHGCGLGVGNVEVSSAYEANVTSILKNDTDVQNLFAQGYNITAIRPIIKNVVDGNGNISTKATTAIALLQKDTSGRAYVTVDLEQGKVTKIVITTRTVIQK